MPYLTCPSCGLPTYCVSEGECPACGTALLWRRAAHPAVPPQGIRTPDAAIRAKLAMAIRELNADSALLSEIADGREHVRWAAGTSPYSGVIAPLRDTICERLLDGRIGSIVADAGAEPSLRGLAPVRDGSIVAYLGVPFSTADARLYVLCCLAGEARPDLGEADLRFLQGVAESLRPLLEPGA